MLVHYMQRKIWKVGTKKLRETHVSIFSICVKQREVLIGDLTILSESESEVSQSCPTLETPWTVAYQASPSMGFSR